MTTYKDIADAANRVIKAYNNKLENIADVQKEIYNGNLPQMLRDIAIEVFKCGVIFEVDDNDIDLVKLGLFQLDVNGVIGND